MFLKPQITLFSGVEMDYKILDGTRSYDHEARFRVHLEVPVGSMLSESDIERILKSAS